MGIKVDPFGVDYGTREITIHNVEELLALPVDSARIVPDKACPICTHNITRPVRGLEGQTLNEAMEEGWLPPHNGCQGKVLLEYKTGEFIIDPRFPTAYTIFIPFSPKSPNDLPAACTSAQWQRIKNDFDRIFEKYLTNLKNWGVMDSAKIIAQNAEPHIYHLQQGLRLANPGGCPEFIRKSLERSLRKVGTKKHYRACSERALELLKLFRSYIKNNNIDYCFAHYCVENGGHALVLVFFKIRLDEGFIEGKEVRYDPWMHFQLDEAQKAILSIIGDQMSRAKYYF